MCPVKGLWPTKQEACLPLGHQVRGLLGPRGPNRASLARPKCPPKEACLAQWRPSRGPVKGGEVGPGTPRRRYAKPKCPSKRLDWPNRGPAEACWAPPKKSLACANRKVGLPQSRELAWTAKQEACLAQEGPIEGGLLGPRAPQKACLAPIGRPSRGPNQGGAWQAQVCLGHQI